MAVLLVLLMLAMALAVAYATSRVNTTSVFIQRNELQRGDARTAALTGMYLALNALHSASWGGVGSKLSGQLADQTSYQVSFDAGDSRLTPSHPEYNLLPYRVTVTSTGIASDAANPSLSVTHVVRAVVELVPTATTVWPDRWKQVQNHQVYQWGTGTVNLELPVQWSGAVWTQGAVNFAPSYPTDDGYPFFGHIDEVAVFDRALSALEITDIYQASLLPVADVANVIRNKGPRTYWRLNEKTGAVTAADEQAFQPGTYAGAKSGQSDIPFGSAVASAFFDGVNDSVDCGNFNLVSSQLTLLCWFKVKQFLPKADMYLVGKGREDETRTQLWSLMLDTRGRSQDYRLKFSVKTNAGLKTLTGGTLTAGLWYFVAAVYDGTQMRLYLNGTQVASTSHSGGLLADSLARVMIGDAPPGSPRARFLRDQRAMVQAGLGDWRTVEGTWRAPAGTLNDEAQALLTDDLLVNVETIANDNTSPVSIVAPPSSYRLFPGGPTYSVPLISSTLSNTTLSANPATNPLGLFRTGGNLQVGDNVTIQGTVLVGNNGSLDLTGSNLVWQPVDLLKLDGESAPRRLPAVVTLGNFWIHNGSRNGSVRGALVVGSEFRFRQASDMGNSCRIEGRLIARNIACNKRTNWPWSATTWQSYLREFLEQQQNPYFPVWLQKFKNLAPQPQLVITADSRGAIDHWPDWSQPIFVVPSGQSGLRWRVVFWQEGN